MADWDLHLWAEGFRAAADRTLVVHHYTSVRGLLGIVRSGAIHGTNVGFLNDTTEITYGLSVCEEVLRDERANRDSAETRSLLENATMFLDASSLPADVYVTSFCKAPDLLGQWRSYGSDGKYCLGFSVAFFSERDVLRLPQEVEYDTDKQRQRVRRVIDAACSHFVRGGENVTPARVGAELALHLRRLACLFKHGSFKEEQEWRSVETVLPDSRPDLIDFQEFEGSPRPYIVMLSGSRESARLPLVDVRIGPSKRPAATRVAVRALLAKFGYDNVGIGETAIPLAP